MKILTAAEMREVDRLTTERFGIPSLTLMENAGKSVAEFVAARFPDFRKRHIVVLCGKGNNGGDGFVAARYLLEMGASPLVHLFADPSEVQGDAGANLKRWEGAGKVVVVRTSDDCKKLKEETQREGTIILDALLGTGARGEVKGVLREAIEDINFMADCVIAVDIPSGLNADTGEVQGAAVRAQWTVTFTAPKRGLVMGEGRAHTGQLIVRPIGSPAGLDWEVGKSGLTWSASDTFRVFAEPRHIESHKGDNGHVLVVAGSVGKTGAAVLSSWAALRAGAGLVTVATPEPALPVVAAHTPEVMTTPLAATLTGSASEKSLDGNLFTKLLEGKSVLAMGPGLGTHPETQSFIRGVIQKHRTLPIVLDADGLNAFDDRANELHHSGQTLCVTPHPGEMARLVRQSVAEIQAHRIETALAAAADWNAVVVLKGYQTVVASPDGSAWINSTGNPGMGTAGTGDVLTGVLSSLTAQYEEWAKYPHYAQLLAFGVFLHGLAGDIAYRATGEAPLMASDLIEAIPAAYKQFYAECGRG